MEKWLEIQKKFSAVMLLKNIAQYQKDLSYARLMTELEQFYKIPMMKDENYEHDNPDVMRVYRMISDSRQSI